MTDESGKKERSEVRLRVEEGERGRMDELVHPRLELTSRFTFYSELPLQNTPFRSLNSAVNCDLFVHLTVVSEAWVLCGHCSARAGPEAGQAASSALPPKSPARRRRRLDLTGQSLSWSFHLLT